MRQEAGDRRGDALAALVQGFDLRDIILCGQDWGGPLAAALGALVPDRISAVVLAIVNVHHYFTDGCVWKLSNPDVRKDLLSHLGK